MKRYIPIIRWRMGETQGRRLAVLLGEAIEVRCHYGSRLFPCLGPACKLAKGGECVEQGKILFYAPALLCEEKDTEPIMEFENEAHRIAYEAHRERIRRQWEEGGTIRRDPCPVPQPRMVNGPKAITPLNPSQPAIAEITDQVIDTFPQPMAGAVYTLDKIKGRLVFRAWRPASPVKGLTGPFEVVPFLERIFGMPLFPPQVEELAEGELPPTIPFRKQA